MEIRGATISFSKKIATSTHRREMEIRGATISFSKKIATSTHRREMEIRCQLDVLDDIICNNFHSSEIDLVLKEFDNLKSELQSIYDKKGMAAIFRSKCR